MSLSVKIVAKRVPVELQRATGTLSFIHFANHPCKLADLYTLETNENDVMMMVMIKMTPNGMQVEIQKRTTGTFSEHS